MIFYKLIFSIKTHQNTDNKFLCKRIRNNLENITKPIHPFINQTSNYHIKIAWLCLTIYFPMAAVSNIKRQLCFVLFCFSITESFDVREEPLRSNAAEFWVFYEIFKTGNISTISIISTDQREIFVILNFLIKIITTWRPVGSRCMQYLVR